MIPHDENGVPDVDALIEICHQGAHGSPHDFEDTLMVQLTQREVWLITLAFLILSQQADCLSDFSAETTERLVELMDTQKQHWRTGD